MAWVMAIITAKPVSAVRRTAAATSPPTRSANTQNAIVKAMIDRKLGSTSAASGLSGTRFSIC